MEIIYKSIPIAPDYKISEYGEIISYKGQKPRILKAYLEDTGYKAVTLCIKGKGMRKRVHQWVALSFLDNPNNLNEVNHKDADKTNNHYSNLEWCTHLHNIRHSFQMGLVGRKSGSESHLYNKGRKVILNGIVYNSVAECARVNKVPRTSLCSELDGRMKTKVGISYVD